MHCLCLEGVVRILYVEGLTMAVIWLPLVWVSERRDGWIVFPSFLGVFTFVFLWLASLSCASVFLGLVCLSCVFVFRWPSCLSCVRAVCAPARVSMVLNALGQ